MENQAKDNAETKEEPIPEASEIIEVDKATDKKIEKEEKSESDDKEENDTSDKNKGTKRKSTEFEGAKNDQKTEQNNTDNTQEDVAKPKQRGRKRKKNEEEKKEIDENKPSVPRATIDISSYLANNSKSVVIASEISELVKSEPCLLGIDEAGRGPVLGPMVYGTCFCPIAKKDEMAALGFDDSKALTEEKREELLEKIIEHKEYLNYAVHVLSPNTISTSMLKRCKYNLNSLSHDTAIGLIQGALDGGANIKEVYVDTVGDPQKYQDKLKGVFPKLDITVAKKADATYPIVSAASICAKVVRDQIMAQWVCKENITLPETGYGSGYPGDANTKKFLQACIDPIFGFPQLVRFSWSTASKILEEKAALMEWEDDEEEDENAKGMANISTFFKTSDGPKRHVYFEERCLNSVASF